MKICNYIKCSEPIGSNPRKKYCCSSHRVRQWEIDNNKPKFMETSKIVSKPILKPVTTSEPEVGSLPNKSNKKLLYGVLGLGLGAAIGDRYDSLMCGLVGFLIGKNQDSKTNIYYSRGRKSFPQLELTSNDSGHFDKLQNGNLVSSSDYQKAIIPSINMNEKYGYLFGDPSPNFYMVLTGEAGSGKSTFATQFGKYYNDNHGKAIYLASEQSGANLALQELFKRYDASFDIHTKPKSLNESQLIQTISKYKLVIFDSANHMNISHEQIEMLRDKLRETAFVVILQSKKDGQFKGTNEWRHNCDIFIKCENKNAKSLKTRFGKLGEVPIMA